MLLLSIPKKIWESVAETITDFIIPNLYPDVMKKGVERTQKSSEKGENEKEK